MSVRKKLKENQCCMVKIRSFQRGDPSPGRDIRDLKIEDVQGQEKIDGEGLEIGTEGDHGQGVLIEEEEDETIVMEDRETMTGGTETEKRELATMKNK